jgi:hypothetical protein
MCFSIVIKSQFMFLDKLLIYSPGLGAGSKKQPSLEIISPPNLISELCFHAKFVTLCIFSNNLAGKKIELQIFRTNTVSPKHRMLPERQSPATITTNLQAMHQLQHLQQRKDKRPRTYKYKL